METRSGLLSQHPIPPALREPIIARGENNPVQARRGCCDTKSLNTFCMIWAVFLFNFFYFLTPTTKVVPLKWVLFNFSWYKNMNIEQAFHSFSYLLWFSNLILISITAFIFYSLLLLLLTGHIIIDNSQPRTEIRFNNRLCALIMFCIVAGQLPQPFGSYHCRCGTSFLMPAG